MKLIPVYILMFFLVMACNDESYTTSPTAKLVFSQDTVRLDTVFSNNPTTTRTFWVYNPSSATVMCSNIRLKNGNQKGYLVNVDGTYLSDVQGYQTSNVEIRGKDSIRVFVALNPNKVYQKDPFLVEDELIFSLESGVSQSVIMQGYAWDSEVLRNFVVDKDTTLTGTGPYQVFGDIVVKDGATLTIGAGSALYFHANAGIEVYGKLKLLGEADKEVVLRGDRLDRMFAYLPYDRVSGQWKGVHIYNTSYDNLFKYTDLHGAFDGIVVDSTGVDKTTLTIQNSSVTNCQGYGLKVTHGVVELFNTLIANTLKSCLLVDGGKAMLNQCTIAQFYPFDSQRGAALYLRSTDHPITLFRCANTLITGYADDVMFGEKSEEGDLSWLQLDHCMIRTPKVTTADSVYYATTYYEDVADTLHYGRKHFKTIDTENLYYEFRLDSVSGAIGKANPTSRLMYDRLGRKRDDNPDIGAFEYLP